jgi:hypothetical protein
MLTRSELFHDKWSVQTVPGNEHLLHSLTIAGSDANDGTLPAGKPVNVTVTGGQWSLAMEFVEMLGGGPLPREASLCRARFVAWLGLIWPTGW